MPHDSFITIERALAVFDFFKNCALFRWSDAHNDCEDRANAICILLDHWQIPNCKAWVFSGYFRHRKEGNLVNRWNYHVAAALPVTVKNTPAYLVIDPSTSDQLVRIEEWAIPITESGTSYHFVKHGSWYIFSNGKITRDNWHKRNKRNFNWTMQGLSGINGVSSKGKAQLAFNKLRVKRTAMLFNQLKNQMPPAFT